MRVICSQAMGMSVANSQQALGWSHENRPCSTPCITTRLCAPSGKLELQTSPAAHSPGGGSRWSAWGLPAAQSVEWLQSMSLGPCLQTTSVWRGCGPAGVEQPVCRRRRLLEGRRCRGCRATQRAGRRGRLGRRRKQTLLQSSNPSQMVNLCTSAARPAGASKKQVQATWQRR